MNKLSLVEVEGIALNGIYGSSKTIFPKRMSYLYPDAEKSIHKAIGALNGNIWFSDMFRSAIASLRRRWPEGKGAPRKGVAKPGHSAHNFGLAVDVAVDKTLHVNGLSKSEFDDLMQEFGWYCHRTDHRRGSEDWHYNYLGGETTAEKLLNGCSKKYTSGAIEKKIKGLYAHNWDSMTPAEGQMCLKKLGLYEDNIDGSLGIHSIHAIRAFQRTWRLTVDGVLGPETKRTLWFRCAEMNLKL